MDPEIRQRALSNPGIRVARWTLPWVLLGIVLIAIFNLAGNFQEAAAERDAALTTGTVDATNSVNATANTSTAKPDTAAKPTEQAKTEPPKTEQPPATTPTTGATVIAIATVEGILLRKEASSSGEVIDRLKNGTEMIVLEQGDSWLKIKDPLGRVGWIRNNPNLISLKQR